jgi:hypothetical protein
LPGETPERLAASQRRTGPRKYEREVLYLHGKARPSTAPGWARREGQRRDRNAAAVAERLRGVMEARYEAAFQAAADAIMAEETLGLSQTDATGDRLDLAVTDVVSRLVDKIREWIGRRTGNYTAQVRGELASMYHATGMAELNRLGLSAESWDVGRDEVQEWARENAGRLIKTIDETVVEQHVRPWLTQTLGDPAYAADMFERAQGIPVALDLAQQLTDKFENYPRWMAERVVRTEAVKGYNLSAADMWERVGLAEVDLFDGLGGKSGMTDAECLARNGQRVTIEEFRELTHKEHPNGTLGAVPVTADVQLKPLTGGVISEGALMSASIYGVTDAGLILSVDEVGRAMAGE